METLQDLLALLILIFQAWMFVDAIRRRQWIWAAFIVLGLVLQSNIPLAAFLYYLFVHRAQSDAGGSLIEIPAFQNRQRVADLKAQIHNLDKAHLHAELGDVYLEMGKWKEAADSYRAAVERDPEDLDYLARLGLCLADNPKTESESLPLLAKVLKEEPDHQYGETAIGYAEALTCDGQYDKAEKLLRRVLKTHDYSRARFRLAELLERRYEFGEAAALLEDVIRDYDHAPEYQRENDRAVVKQAKKLLKKIEPPM